MKNCIKLFLLLCLLLAIGSISASEHSTTSIKNTNLPVTDEPHVPIIDLLQEGERYEIEILSIGCFNGSKQVLGISKEAQGYSVDFEGTSKLLDNTDVEAIRDFELALHSLSRGGCSTVDTYTLTYGADTYRTADGTCSFNGGRKLMERLGLVPGK